jgi:acyl-coenzyme A synthetase/AMP-(fatty) acid ligase
LAQRIAAEDIIGRIDDAGAKLVITADGGYRKGKVSPLKPAVDMALADRNGSGPQESVEHVLVVKRGGNAIDWTEGRDIWWDKRPQDLLERRRMDEGRVTQPPYVYGLD